MSPSNMTAKDRRALYLGLGILVPALLFIWGVKPLLANLNTTRHDIVEQSAMLANEEAAVAAAKRNPRLKQIADSAMSTMTPRLFEGKDDDMAAAEILSHLSELAVRSNVVLRTARTGKATVDNGVRSLRVDIAGESDLAGVLTFLESLESGEKLLRVDRIDISKSVAASADKGVEPLAITGTIVGYAIVDPSAPPPVKAKGGIPRPTSPGIPQRGGR